MDFYIKLEKQKSHNNMYYKSFCIGATPMLRYELRKLINKEVCKSFDNKLKNCNVKAIIDNKNLFNRYDNFTYSFLNDLIENIRYDFIQSGNTDYVRFYTDYTELIRKYDVNREFCDIMQRLIEFGNDTLFPMQIFNKAYTQFNSKITKRYNNIFRG